MSKEMFDYLDSLRESGVTNMFGAGSYLMEEFGIDQKQAHKILQDWMQSFSRDKEVL